MIALNSTQIGELTSIANSGQSGARVAYYTKLAEFGVPYGRLALGVVLEDQMSGRVANSFFQTVAAREGISVSSAQWAAVGDALMQADIVARLANDQVNSNGELVYVDLTYNAIRQYHESVFNDLGGTVGLGQGVSIQGWTAYAPVELLGAGTWDDLVSGAGIDGLAAQANVLFGMYAAAWNIGFGSIEKVREAELWTDAMSQAFSSAFGQGETIAFPDQVESAFIVMGTHDSDELSLTQDVSDRSVLMLGLGGDDTILAHSGGGYVDGGTGDDLIIGQGSNAHIDGGEGVDTLQLNSPNGFTTTPHGTDAFINASASERGLQGNAHYFNADLTSKTGEVFTRIETLTGTEGHDSIGVNRFFSDALRPTFLTVDGRGGNDMLSLIDEGGTVWFDVDLERTSGNVIVHGSDGAGLIRLNVRNIETIMTAGGNDIVRGDHGDSKFYVLDGFNIVDGRGGNDTIYGGKDTDQLSGGSGNDELIGFAGDDLLYGDEGNDELWGHGGNDVLLGGAGTDLLYGNDGDDRLDGGDGKDRLSGGAGADTFVMSGGVDVVTDFALGVDRLYGSGGVLSQGERFQTVLITSAEGSMILERTRLVDAQRYDELGLLWT